ncbi:MAG: LysR family transcriptional regulator [Ruminococcus sp.]|nr:LysR family transcriptional regulator [Ruminococcus sp.]
MLKQIRYFQSVVKLGSFTEAAEEHYISQSAISQQIKALEDELGVKLLERKKRSFTLTEAGEYFYRKSLVLVAD